MSVKSEYEKYSDGFAPKSRLAADMLKAFLTGGLICCVGQGVGDVWRCLGLNEEDAAAAAAITMIFFGALLTALGVYDKIAKMAGAGTLVPITGFANSIVSPAMEFRAEGFITGTAVKMFAIAGPVIVFGTAAGAAYGVILTVLGAL